jgi:hypothetical protein
MLLDDSSHMVQINMNTSHLLVNSGAERWRLFNTEDVSVMVCDIEPPES